MAAGIGALGQIASEVKHNREQGKKMAAKKGGMNYEEQKLDTGKSSGGGDASAGKSSPPAAPAGGGSPIPSPPSMKKGGRVKKTKRYLLHKDEQVIPAKKAKNLRAAGAFKKSRGKMKKVGHAECAKKLASPPSAKKVQKHTKNRKRQYGKR